MVIENMSKNFNEKDKSIKKDYKAEEMRFMEELLKAEADGAITTQELLDLEKRFKKIETDKKAEQDKILKEIGNELNYLRNRILRKGITITDKNKKKILNYLENEGFIITEEIKQSSGKFGITADKNKIIKEGFFSTRSNNDVTYIKDNLFDKEIRIKLANDLDKVIKLLKLIKLKNENDRKIFKFLEDRIYDLKTIQEYLTSDKQYNKEFFWEPDGLYNKINKESMLLLINLCNSFRKIKNKDNIKKEILVQLLNQFFKQKPIKDLINRIHKWYEDQSIDGLSEMECEDNGGC